MAHPVAVFARLVHHPRAKRLADRPGIEDDYRRCAAEYEQKKDSVPRVSSQIFVDKPKTSPPGLPRDIRSQFGQPRKDDLSPPPPVCLHSAADLVSRTTDGTAMAHYTIVISDAEDHDAGFRGTDAFWWLAGHFGAYAELGLYWFLREYYGPQSVTLMRPSQLLRLPERHQTDWLFVGLPTTLSDEHLSKLDFDRMALYDSTDLHGVKLDYSDRSLLFSHTNICLKNWRDDRLDYPCQIGLLPIKRPPLNNKMHAAVRMSSAKRRFGLAPKKDFDVGFVARPTGDMEKNQRVRWLIDLKQQRPDLKLWGGLVGGRPWQEVAKKSSQDVQALQSCWLPRRKIGFFQYFAGLCQSKVALAPAGYAPWTYRHFEAIYARSVVVSNDLSHHEFLIPFPREGMVEVGDDGSIVDAIEAALTMYQSSPGVVESNIQHLNRWLDNGMYSKKRRDTVDRFWAQLAHV